MKAVLLGLVLLLGLLLVAHMAAAQTYVATEVGQPCPPNDVPVMLKDGRWMCAVTATLTPLENPIPKDSK
jgi:hypothetical protein